MRGIWIRPWMAAAVVLVVCATGAGAAQAAALNISVTTTTDDGNSSGADVGNCATTDTSCNLRQAINTTNIAANAGSTITVPAGTYTPLSGGSFPGIFPTTSVTINGAAGGGTIIDGGGTTAPAEAFNIN